MATNKKEHTCIKEPKLIEIEGKMKGNNELTLLQLKNMNEKMDGLKLTIDATNKLITDYITEEKEKEEEKRKELEQKFIENDKKFVKIESVKLAINIISYFTAIIVGAWGLLKFVAPLLLK